MTPSTLFDLKGKTALITGGSQGQGLRIAEALGEAGARHVISSRTVADLEGAKAHLEAQSVTVDYVAADNGKDADIIPIADAAIGKLGRVDILVNNAGGTWLGAAEDHPIEAWDRVMNLNVRSLFLLLQQIAHRARRVGAQAQRAWRQGGILVAHRRSPVSRRTTRTRFSPCLSPRRSSAAPKRA
jgi:gluconate 5-dehydrogenase